MKSWGWPVIKHSLNGKEAGPGRSMANCVTQRKPGPACSQLLRSGRFEAFQDKVEWSGQWMDPSRKWEWLEDKTRGGMWLLDWTFFPESKRCWQTRSWKSSLVLLRKWYCLSSVSGGVTFALKSWRKKECFQQCSLLRLPRHGHD